MSAPNHCSRIVCSACMRDSMHFSPFSVLPRHPASTPASQRILGRATSSPSTCISWCPCVHDHKLNRCDAVTSLSRVAVACVSAILSSFWPFSTASPTCQPELLFPPRLCCVQSCLHVFPIVSRRSGPSSFESSLAAHPRPADHEPIHLHLRVELCARLLHQLMWCSALFAVRWSDLVCLVFVLVLAHSSR